ncbi:MAG: amidase [Alphaproteobacteria bacterium]|nr:amidase [Alphaproteobacteria bacterium]
MRDELGTWDAVETAERIAAGDVSAREVVEAAIARAEQHALNAIVTPTFERALDEVGRGVRGPLAGVPTFVKDLDHLAGVRTGFGSRAFRDLVPRETSPNVAQLLSTGLVALGKSATPEFGLTCATEPLAHRPTVNPRAPGFSPGGSSGGAAALVSAGVVPIAHASDGGGSIRIPAASTGLVGLKPSQRRLVPLDGVTALPVPIATPGVLTRTVRDTAAWFAAAEQAFADPSLPPVGHVRGPGTARLRVGLYTGSPLGSPIDPEVVAAARGTAATLEELGHRVTEVPFPFDDRFERDFLLYWAFVAWATAQLGRRAGDRFDRRQLEPWTQGLMRSFRRRAWRLPTAILRLRRFARTWDAGFEGIDVLVTPVTAAPPPPLGHLAPTVPFDQKRERLLAYVPYTPAHNVSGAPGISLPLGRSSDGRPIGVQLSTRVGGERTLLELAYELEQARPWPLA